MLKIFIALILFCASILYAYQEKLVFYPQKLETTNRVMFSKYEISVNFDGVDLRGWFVKGEISEERPLLIYYGGNAEEVSYNLWDLERYGTSSFLFMNYRGYGDSEGTPTEENLYKDALYLFDYIIKKERIAGKKIVLLGRSIGSAVATHVASRRHVKGLILVSPFDSLVNIGKHHYPILPVKYLLRHKFDSTALAPQIDRPAIFIIGDSDQIIPNNFSMNFINSWGGQYQTVVIEGAGHNDLSGSMRYWQAINGFLSSG